MAKRKSTSKKTDDFQAFKSESFVHIPIDNIEAPRVQARTSISDQSLLELEKSIQNIGLLQPIVVVRRGDKFFILSGYRRYLAHVHLKRSSILARIITVSEQTSLVTTWHENSFREDLNPYDEALFVSRVSEITGQSQTELANILGKSQQWVSNRLAVLKWPQPIQEALRNNYISFSVGRELSAIDNIEILNHYLHHAIQNGITPAVARSWKESYLANMGPPPEPTALPDQSEIPQYGGFAPLTCQACMQQGEVSTMSHVWVHSRCWQAILEALREADQS